jgi:hypothetical protein
MTTAVDDQDDSVVSRGGGLAARFARIVQRTRSVEASAALIALLAIATLWRMPWIMTVVAVLIIGFALVVVIVERAQYWVGWFLSAHLVLISGAVATFVTQDDYFAAIGALLVGAGAVAGGVFSSSIARLSSPVSANLDGVDDFPSLIGLSRVTHVALGAATVITVFAASFSISVVSVIVGVIGAVIGAVLAGSIYFANRRRERATVQGFRALAAIEPVFYLHWDAPSEGHYQVTMWLPYLKRVGLPFAIIVRTRRQLNTLAALTDVPLLLCTSGEQVERTVVPSLRSVLFVNTALRNAHYLRFNGIRSIQLNHGDSDKPASATRQFRAFDRNLVAGQAAVDRFAHYGVHMPHKLLRIVGRPQVEGVRRVEVPVSGDHTVLYAPTWSGFFGDSNLSSLPVGEAMVKALLARGCTVIFRPHAFTVRNAALSAAADRVRALLAADAAATGRAHIYGARAETEMSVFDCFNASDAMVADVSSIVSDYLYSEKPFAMVAVGIAPKDFEQAYPVAKASYVVDPGLPFDEPFDAMLGADPLRETRQQSRRYYLGDFAAEGYSDVFVSALREEINLTGVPQAG